MRKLYTIISFIFFFCVTQTHAQLDSIQQLKEVLIVDRTLKEYSDGFKLTVLSDTLIKKNSASLTDVLRYNSTIYFKENGYGMISSPSFRGTNASQTAVIWNGIPINSTLNGQTDFNTIGVNNYNSIIIRSGGGSSQYASGAIGGSIHLNNNISFLEKSENILDFSYGSFSTLGGKFKTTQSNKKSYINLGVDFISSENDYTYLNKAEKNENGEFVRFNTSINAGFRFKKSILIWNSNYFLGDRNLSGTLTAASKDKYKDATSRNLISWITKANKFQSTLKAAHLFERYRYFPNKEKSLFFEGKSNTLIANYLLEYHLNNNMKISAIIDYTFINAVGSNISKNKRNTLATVLLMNHKVSDRFSYGINLRQEYLNDFENPFLYSIDGKYLINQWYTIKLNASKNYRVPTFNDLYWDQGGNKYLKPETSYQFELGNEFLWNKFQFKVNGFYIVSEDLIKWQPNEGGQFSPINIQETENIGFELSGNYTKKFDLNQFSVLLNYAYTSAIDKEKNKQLIYVPSHLVTGNINYSYKNISAYYQILYNGEVFTTTDNIGTVDNFSVSNIGFKMQLKNAAIGIKANNIFNKYYESIAYRPMPNRNYQIFINLKF